MTLKQDLDHVNSKVDINDIALRLGLTDTVAKDFLRIALANTVLFQRKHNDYGPDNIREFMAFGCLVRMLDKFRRLKYLYETGRRKKAKNEKIEDSWQDLSNYAIIALLCEDSKWP